LAALTRFLDDGRVCLPNNAAERALRGVAVGRKNWTYAGSDAGGHRAAAVYPLIETCKMNEVDPQAWLADVLARQSSRQQSRRLASVELSKRNICFSSGNGDRLIGCARKLSTACTETPS
jgi:hypothetical protein